MKRNVRRKSRKKVEVQKGEIQEKRISDDGERR